jgi:hypothetical protein
MLGAVFTAWATAAPAIEMGQIDDFQGGNTAGWRSGAPNPTPPDVVNNLGPAGTGDHALRIRSTGGNGPGSMLVAFNTSQWRGSYTEAQVGSLALHARNTGNSSLQLRVTLAGPGGQLSSTTAFPLGANSSWQTLVFPVTEADLTRVSGTNSAATLDGASELRLLHNSVPNYRADSINTTLLVDNIIALPLGWMPGDTDLDLDVDSADLTNLTLGWTGSLDDQPGGRTLRDGDADGDLDVDSADLTAMVLNWTGSADPAPLSQVPEPGGAAYLAFVVVGWQLAVRRRLSGRRAGI